MLRWQYILFQTQMDTFEVLLSTPSTILLKSFSILYYCDAEHEKPAIFFDSQDTSFQLSSVSTGIEVAEIQF